MSADESITSLSEAVAVYGALPMPAGPAPQGLDLDACVSRALRLARQYDGPGGVDQDDLDQLTDFDVPQLVAEVRAGRIELEKARAQIVNHGPVLVALEQARARVAELEADLAAKAQDAGAAVAGWGRARDRIAELESDLALANGVLEDMAQARRDCPCAVDRPHQVGCPQDGVPVAASSFAERAAAESDPGRRVAWRMLAEPDGEFHGTLHHDYRVGHDLPETGGV